MEEIEGVVLWTHYIRTVSCQVCIVIDLSNNWHRLFKWTSIKLQTQVEKETFEVMVDKDIVCLQIMVDR